MLTLKVKHLTLAIMKGLSLISASIYMRVNVLLPTVAF